MKIYDIFLNHNFNIATGIMVVKKFNLSGLEGRQFKRVINQKIKQYR